MAKGGGSSSASKVLTEYEDEVVQYEPWMDNYGSGKGIEFGEDDELCLQHPELWLDPNEMGKDEKNGEDEKPVMDGGTEVTKSNKKSNSGRSSKKENKKNRKQEKNRKKKELSNSSPKVAANRAPVRPEDKDVDKIARQIAQNQDPDDVFFSIGDDNDLFNFENDGDLDFM